MAISKLSLPILTVGLMFSGAGSLAAETNWIVRPLIDSETNQVSCVGIYQDYSHQLLTDKLILFIPGEFDQFQIELTMELNQTSPQLIVAERQGFALTIAGDLFQQVIMADQLVVKTMQGEEIVGEYVINLTGINEAVHLLQTETCADGDIYQFPPAHFLMYEQSPIEPMIVPNWTGPKPTPPPGMPSNTNIKFPRPSRDGLPDSTGGGGTRLMEEPDGSDTAF